MTVSGRESYAVQSRALHRKTLREGSPNVNESDEQCTTVSESDRQCTTVNDSERVSKRVMRGGSELCCATSGQ